jgi:hypothetical protein
MAAPQGEAAARREAPQGRRGGLVSKQPKQGRRADDISADEIKQFWHDFCERRDVDAATRARGDAKIEADPEYWADQTMFRLLDAVAT